MMMMETRDALPSSLIRSIFFTLGTYFAIQVAAIIGMSGMSGFPYFWSLVFTLAVHTILITFISVRAEDFQLVTGGAPKEHINLANRLTLFRISSVPTFLHVLIIAEEQREFVPVLLVFAVIISITDLLDGLIARRLQQVTKLGRYLDSSSDYGLLLVITAAFLNMELVPGWLILLILLRYSFQSLAAIVILLRYQRHGSGATIIGKAAVFFLVLYYNLIFLSLLPRIAGVMQMVLQILQWVCAITLVISLIERLILFVRDLYLASSSKPPRLFPQKL